MRRHPLPRSSPSPLLSGAFLAPICSFGKLPKTPARFNRSATRVILSSNDLVIRCRYVLFSNVLAIFLLSLSNVVAQSALTQGQEHKKVLLLSSQDSNMPAAVIIEQSLRSTLRNSSPVGVEVYTEYLDSNRTRVGDYGQELIAMLRRKYEGKKFDLIFVIEAPALRVLLENQHEIFQDVPIVFMAFDERTLSDLVLEPNVTGVWGEVSLKPSLDLALRLQPETKKVVVVAGVSEFDKYWTTKAREDFRGFEGKLEFTYLIGLTLAEYQKALRSLPQDTIVFLMTVTRDNAGNNYLNLDVLRQISPASSVPIYGSTDAQLGLGIVGGKLVSFEAIGAQMAQMGERVLAGEQARAIAPHGIPSTVMFDWRELRRWGISEQKLPPGSIVQFKQLTVWERYKWHIIGIISLCIFEALLIGYLLITLTSRRRAEKESERFAQLAKAEHRHLDEVVSNTPGIVWESRLEPGTATRKIEFVNDYVEEMLGYSVEECLSAPNFWQSILLEEDREASVRGVEAILAEGREGIQQFRCVRKDGRTLWVEAHLVAIGDETGESVGLRGVAMDISDRRQAEAALQENQAQLAGIIGSAMDAIISIDERQRVVLFNTAAETMFGCTASEALGQPLNLFIPTPFRDAQQDQLSATKQTNGAVLYAGSFASLTGRRADGQDFPIDVSISEVELNGTRFYTIILRDITERLRTVAALRERKEELSEAQRVAKVGSWEWEPTI